MKLNGLKKLNRRRNVMKKTYVIDLMGCDDSTVFKMDLDETELELVKKIAKKSEELSECSS